MKYRLLLPLALAACTAALAAETGHTTPPAAAASTGAAPTTIAPDAAMLIGYHWQLNEATASDGTHIDALLARPNRPVQLDFANDRVRVTGACNAMSGSYHIEAGTLVVGPMMHTMMACADHALMAMEGAIDQRLHARPQLSLQAGGPVPQLKLVTSSGDTLVFTGVPTPETRYGGAGVTEFLEVAAQTTPCSHPLMPNHQCLNVRTRHYDAYGLKAGTPGAWHPLYQNIEGYTHEAGVRNVLRVKRYTVKNPPADASSVAYVLDMVVESEMAKH